MKKAFVSACSLLLLFSLSVSVFAGAGNGLNKTAAIDDFFGGLFGRTTTEGTTVPGETASSETETETTTETEYQTATPVTGETINRNMPNPYAKPAVTLNPGAQNDGVKWMQWIFIYTGYGLQDNGLTGVYDNATLAVVEKLQKENGFTVNGTVDSKTIDKIDLLYYQYKVGADTSARYIAPSATLQTVTESVTQSSFLNSIKNHKWLTAAFIVVAIWLIVAVAILLTMTAKKRRLELEAKQLQEAKPAASPQEKKAVPESPKANFEVTKPSGEELSALTEEKNKRRKYADVIFTPADVEDDAIVEIDCSDNEDSPKK